MPQSIDEKQAIADIYATALLSIAQKNGLIEQIRSELEELVSLEERDPDFSAFISSTAIDATRRAKSLETMFRGKFSDELLNTILVMSRNGRSGLLPYLLHQYKDRQQQAAGQVEVTAISAVELGADQRTAVTATAAKVSGRIPVISFAVDPAILGGLILEVGDLRYDNSVRTQLESARTRLLDRGQRGLEVGIQA